MNVEQWEPDKSEAVSLLNEAYDPWGTTSLFEWRYNCCPGYDPSAHVFHITSGNELVAFRRVTYKELNTSGRKTPVYVLGDTAVAQDYQGQGLYSQIHDESTSYCSTNGAPILFTFNRKGNITFKANRKRDWAYRELPLHLRILSPSTVIPNYAQLVFEEAKTVRKVAEVLGSRIVFHLSDGELSLNEVSGKSSGVKTPNLSVHLSDIGVKSLVEAASNDPNFASLLRTGTRMIFDGHVSFWHRENVEKSHEVNSTEHDFKIEHRTEFSDDEIDELEKLYSSFLSEYEISFRRTFKDVNHLLNHPGLVDVLLVRDDNELVGLAPLAFHPGADVDELRALDLVYKNGIVFETLIHEIELSGFQCGADLIAILTSSSPGDRWVPIEKQVIMWDQISDETPSTEELIQNDWYFGFYDIA